jgi:hypothetical protein
MWPTFDPNCGDNSCALVYVTIIVHKLHGRPAYGPFGSFPWVTYDDEAHVLSYTNGWDV